MTFCPTPQLIVRSRKAMIYGTYIATTHAMNGPLTQRRDVSYSVHQYSRDICEELEERVVILTGGSGLNASSPPLAH